MLYISLFMQKKYKTQWNTATSTTARPHRTLQNTAQNKEYEGRNLQKKKKIQQRDPNH